jgi:DNA replication protein DnaC
VSPTEKETEDIRRGLAAAAQKRSKKPWDISMLKPRVDIRELGRPLADGDYCAVCTYPKLTDLGCECEAQKRRVRELELQHIEAVGGERAWRTYTIEGFQRTEFNAQAFDAAVAFQPGRQSIMFHGPYGSGKSRMAAIAKRPWILKGVPTKTIVLDEFYVEVRSHLKSVRDQKALIDFVINVPILGIEDLGAEKDSEWTTNTLFQIIDGRYKKGKTGLIVTSNFNPDHIAAKQGNQRVASRLREMCKIFSLAGEKDWRREAQP